MEEKIVIFSVLLENDAVYIVSILAFGALLGNRHVSVKSQLIEELENKKGFFSFLPHICHSPITVTWQNMEGNHFCSLFGKETKSLCILKMKHICSLQPKACCWFGCSVICMQWAICRFRFVSQGKQPSSSVVFHFMLSIQLHGQHKYSWFSRLMI